MADSTASGELWQQRPYPAPGKILRGREPSEAETAGPRQRLNESWIPYLPFAIPCVCCLGIFSRINIYEVYILDIILYASCHGPGVTESGRVILLYTFVYGRSIIERTLNTTVHCYTWQYLRRHHYVTVCYEWALVRPQLLFFVLGVAVVFCFWCCTFLVDFF